MVTCASGRLLSINRYIICRHPESHEACSAGWCKRSGRGEPGGRSCSRDLLPERGQSSAPLGGREKRRLGASGPCRIQSWAAGLGAAEPGLGHPSLRANLLEEVRVVPRPLDLEPSTLQGFMSLCLDGSPHSPAHAAGSCQSCIRMSLGAAASVSRVSWPLPREEGVRSHSQRPRPPHSSPPKLHPLYAVLGAVQPDPVLTAPLAERPKAGGENSRAPADRPALHPCGPERPQPPAPCSPCSETTFPHLPSTRRCPRPFRHPLLCSSTQETEKKPEGTCSRSRVTATDPPALPRTSTSFLLEGRNSTEAAHASLTVCSRARPSSSPWQECDRPGLSCPN